MTNWKGKHINEIVNSQLARLRIIEKELLKTMGEMLYKENNYERFIK